MRCLHKIGAICTVAVCTLATTAFGQSGRASGNNEGIDRFIAVLKDYEFRSPSSQSDEREVQELLKLGRSVIVSQNNVNYFNAPKDETKDKHVSMISKLVDISTINNPDFRINAGLILVDVTENRTVCAVLNKLIERDLPDASRSNLLQVVKVVSYRLKYSDVKSWMKAMIQQNREFIEKVPNMEKTQNLLSEIERRVDSKEVKETLERDDDEIYYKQCMELKNIKSLRRS
jgi:hypothetical protein